MNRFITILVFAITCTIAGAQDAGTERPSAEPVRSIFSIDAGFTSDGRSGHGYGIFIKSSSFIGDGPFYYGFGSIFGDFITTKENFFETGLFLGYNDLIGDTGLDIDIFLDLIATGGRIDQETKLYRAEAPALHPGISVGFPVMSNFDAALTFAPVIRPYDAYTGNWDFSRSYYNVSLALKFKSYLEATKLSWNKSSIKREGALK